MAKVLKIFLGVAALATGAAAAFYAVKKHNELKELEDCDCEDLECDCCDEGDGEEACDCECGEECSCDEECGCAEEATEENVEF